MPPILPAPAEEKRDRSNGTLHGLRRWPLKIEMIAQAAFDALHRGAMPFAVEWGLNEIGLDALRSGDVRANLQLDPLPVLEDRVRPLQLGVLFEQPPPCLWRIGSAFQQI